MDRDCNQRCGLAWFYGVFIVIQRGNSARIIGTFERDTTKVEILFYLVSSEETVVDTI